MRLLPLPLDDYRDDAPARWTKSQRVNRQRKLEALVEAEFRCTACGADDNLTIHHLTRLTGKRDKRTVLCVGCHLAAHGRAA